MGIGADSFDSEVEKGFFRMRGGKVAFEIQDKEYFTVDSDKAQTVRHMNNNFHTDNMPGLVARATWPRQLAEEPNEDATGLYAGILEIHAD